MKTLAVVLPVMLGLGLIYLFVIGGLDGSAVAICLVAMVMLVPLVGVLVDAASSEIYRSEERRRLSRRVPSRRSA